MKVLIFEPGSGTHFYQYVALIAQACSAIGCEVVVSLSRDAERLMGFDEFIRPLTAQPRIAVDYTHPPLEGSDVRKVHALRLRYLREAIDKHRPGHVLVPFGDGLAHEVGLRRLTARSTFRRGVDVETLLFKGRLAYPFDGASRREQLVEWAKWRMVEAGRWHRTMHIDPFACEMQRRRKPKGRLRLEVMPEPLEAPSRLSRAEARSKLNLPPEGRLIALPGAVDGRKGADRLLKAFAHAELRPDDRVLLMGKVSRDMGPLLAGEFAPLVASGRIIVRDGFVSDEDLLASLVAADVVAAPHRSCYQSSGIVMRAAVAGRPIVGTREGWIGRTVREFGLGETCDVTRPDEFGRAIASTLAGAADFRPGEASRRLGEFHTIANFQATWTRGIRAKLGLAEPAGLRDWTWVAEAAAGEDRAADAGRAAT